MSPQKLSGEAPKTVNTLTWQSGALEFVAIGDVPESDLAQLRAAFNV